MPARKKVEAKKAVRRTKKVTKKVVTVKIGRMNTPTGTYELEDGVTISDALEQTGLTLNSSETVWLNGEKEDMDTILETGDIIQIVVKKDGGLV